jgi:hypothetical protein
VNLAGGPIGVTGGNPVTADLASFFGYGHGELNPLLPRHLPVHGQLDPAGGGRRIEDRGTHSATLTVRTVGTVSTVVMADRSTVTLS